MLLIMTIEHNIQCVCKVMMQFEMSWIAKKLEGRKQSQIEETLSKLLLISSLRWVPISYLQNIDGTAVTAMGHHEE